MAKLRIDGLDELKRNFDEAPEVLGKAAAEAMRKSTELVKIRARRKAGSPPIVFTGELARSIEATSTSKKGKIIARARHGAPVEFGTRPHFPPVAPLERWARIKLGKPGLGFVIARKISVKGTKPQPFFEPAAEESIRDIERFFEQIGQKVVVKLAQ